MSPESLVEAVYAGEAPALAEQRLNAGADPDAARLEAVLAASSAIAARIDVARTEAMAALDAAGVDATASSPPKRAQRNAFSFDVADRTDARAVVRALEPLGYEPWSTWTGGARRSHEHHADRLSVVRTTEVTMVVRIAWPAGPPPTRWRRLVTPTSADWRTVALPGWGWRAYPLVRLARLALERLGLRPRHVADLGPFLATAASLLDPLLDMADTGPDDVVVDIGCGDGRFLVAAAERGCRAIGVEHDDGLARRARERAAEAGVADRVTVIVGDASEAPLHQADVVFVFLPSSVLTKLVPTVLRALKPGARVIAHEQTRLPASMAPRPTHSQVVVGLDSLTVAHRWDA